MSYHLVIYKGLGEWDPLRDQALLVVPVTLCGDADVDEYNMAVGVRSMALMLGEVPIDQWPEKAKTG